MQRSQNQYHHLNLLLLLGWFVGFSINASAQTIPEITRTRQFNTQKGLALAGYDPVAYLKNSEATKGSAQFATTYKSTTYWFATATNREIFLKNPTQYEPAYGGWCAYAMGATGEKVAVDPETFEVRDGRLYLFYNRLFNNTLPKWQKDVLNLHRRADTNWQKLTQS